MFGTECSECIHNMASNHNPTNIERLVETIRHEPTYKLALSYCGCWIGITVVVSLLNVDPINYAFTLFPLAGMIMLQSTRRGWGTKHAGLLATLVVFEAFFLFASTFAAYDSTQWMLDKNSCSSAYPEELGTQTCRELIPQVQHKQVLYGILLGFSYSSAIILLVYFRKNM